MDTENTQPLYRSGVVAIVGPPNAGKSTLLNRYLGQKIAIVTPRPQTTRNRILGIVTGPDYQIIMLDTPGLHKARELLNREMVRIAMESLGEADVVLFLADASAFAGNKKKLEKHRQEYTGYLDKVRTPAVLALNKIDLLRKEELLPVIDWYSSLHPFDAVVPISALQGVGTDTLLEELVSRLPEGPQYYPDDIPTDATERFIVAEIIREKIFLLTREEVPYSTAVLIDSFQEEKNRVTIHATILVERSSQKGIIIGRKGQMLVEIGRSARLEIEELLGCRVVLKLWVKVKKKWTRNEQILKELGL
ncbi:GTPase Era [Desulfolithobacter dissulfuricans]|uniref:GTPase Era n=1 Tax=Desulfolithobacter dissulfuricans TaxID=2795293 RepID=A0A915U0Q7_9BACT|nr:GTPase Era [Desulfolithobacter dissulfuricans]BCO08844.1 GTPase Era [Desulfolithobacter dissulfuricans]